MDKNNCASGQLKKAALASVGKFNCGTWGQFYCFTTGTGRYFRLRGTK